MQRKRYDEEFKRKVLAERQPGAKPVDPIAKYGIGRKTLWTWMKEAGVAGASATEIAGRPPGIDLSVAPVNKVLRRHGFKPVRGWQRFERPRPQELWQMDIMTFGIRELYRVYLITAPEDQSRFVVNWGFTMRRQGTPPANLRKAGGVSPLSTSDMDAKCGTRVCTRLTAWSSYPVYGSIAPQSPVAGSRPERGTGGDWQLQTINR